MDKLGPEGLKSIVSYVCPHACSNQARCFRINMWFALSRVGASRYIGPGAAARGVRKARLTLD